MVLIQKQLHIDPWNTREDDVCKDFQNFLRQFQLLANSYALSSVKYDPFGDSYAPPHYLRKLREWHSLIHDIYDILRDFRPDTYTYTDTDTDTDSDTDTDADT